ncbi:hypothetical protein [Salmonella enterica]|uniref:hypothetical protein n=1 Tax=Salmonella enterica TaxID=28901 RepID=UPI0016575354|nr:hypothetical protein [Salmonella enterica]
MRRWVPATSPTTPRWNDNATLELNTGGTFDNVISGSGQVVKSGDDALTLSGRIT